MTTQALTPRGLLDDLLICEHCNLPMKQTQGHNSFTYECIKSATLPTGDCPTPTFDAEQLNHDIIAEIADKLLTPDTSERLVAATRNILGRSANIGEIDADPHRYSNAILQFARHPETYTRPEVYQQTKEFLAITVERIAITANFLVIQFAVPLPLCKIALGDDDAQQT